MQQVHAETGIRIEERYMSHLGESQQLKFRFHRSTLSVARPGPVFIGEDQWHTCSGSPFIRAQGEVTGRWEGAVLCLHPDLLSKSVIAHDLNHSEILPVFLSSTMDVKHRWILQEAE